MAHLVHNERLKLMAAALNTAATTAFGLGVLAPLVAALYNPAALTVTDRTVAIGFFLWSASATALHVVARWLLGSLKE